MNRQRRVKFIEKKEPVNLRVVVEHVAKKIQKGQIKL